MCQWEGGNIFLNRGHFRVRPPINKKIVLTICKVSGDQKNYGGAWSGDGLGGCEDGNDNSGTH